jgi:hypothetical protein
VSRQIDITKPLSEEDLAYLDSRARHDLIEQNRRLLGEQEAQKEPVNDGHTGDIDPFKVDDGTDLVAGTHPGETPVNGIQAIEAQGISDLGDKDKDPDGVVSRRVRTEPTQQAGDALEGSDSGDGEDDEDDEFSGLTNAELRDELEARGLSKSGTKAEMKARLREHESQS